MRDIIIIHLAGNEERGYLIEETPIGIKFHSDDSGKEVLMHPSQFRSMEIIPAKGVKV